MVSIELLTVYGSIDVVEFESYSDTQFHRTRIDHDLQLHWESPYHEIR